MSCIDTLKMEGRLHRLTKRGLILRISISIILILFWMSYYFFKTQRSNLDFKVNFQDITHPVPNNAQYASLLYRMP